MTKPDTIGTIWIENISQCPIHCFIKQKNKQSRFVFHFQEIFLKLSHFIIFGVNYTPSTCWYLKYFEVVYNYCKISIAVRLDQTPIYKEKLQNSDINPNTIFFLKNFISSTLFFFVRSSSNKPVIHYIIQPIQTEQLAWKLRYCFPIRNFRYMALNK